MPCHQSSPFDYSDGLLGQKESITMSSAGLRLQTHEWLREHGPGELEQLFRAVAYQPDPAQIPAWVQQHVLFLLDSDHTVVSRYPGAERIQGHSAE